MPCETSILERIRKLLELSKSPEQHEAETALAMAYRLMEEHDISIHDITADMVEYQKKEYARAGRAPEEDIFIRFILEDFFNVATIRCRGIGTWYIVYIVGKAHHLLIAEYVLNYLRGVFKSLWKLHQRSLTKRRQSRRRKNNIRKAFNRGVYIGLKRRLQEIKYGIEQEHGIVLIKDPGLQEFLKSEFPGSTSKSIQQHAPSQRDFAAYLRGHAEGKKIEINKPIAAMPVRLLNPKSEIRNPKS